MTRQELLSLLEENGIDASAVSFDDDVKDGWGIRKNHSRWEVYFRERGRESDVRGFPSESDALACLLHELISLKNRIAE